MSAPSRPILRYHGGKWRMADKILPFFPHHHAYVEAFGGGASILLSKARSRNEIYNDLDEDIVNLFRVLRSQKDTKKLIKLIERTPFAREEMKEAWEDSEDRVEKARRLLVRSHMGFGSTGATKSRTGFRGLEKCGGAFSAPSRSWCGIPKVISDTSKRLQGVVIENCDAIQLIETTDTSDTLFYLDPPYLPTTRSSMKSNQKYYRYEMTEDDHIALLETALKAKGMVIISGYESALYMDMLTGWDLYKFKSRAASAQGTVEREECLWISPHAKAKNKGLFI